MWMDQWLLVQSDAVIYGFIFFILLTGAIIFPPEDVSLILAGIVIQKGKGDPIIILLICYLGTVLADFFIYFVGRKFGKALSKKAWVKSKLRPGRIEAIRKGLEKRSLVMIFIARHLFYLRTVTFLTCGMVTLNFLRFASADCLSALVSVPLMVWIGFEASEHYDTVTAYISQAKIFSLVLVIVIALVVAAALKRAQRQFEEDPEDTSV